MKKFVLIPDSFKGTLSSSQICQIMQDRIAKFFPDALVKSIPVADGGEGSVDCFLTALGGEKVYVNCKNPYFEDMQGYYGLINNGQTAVIEMAVCAGLPMVEDRKNPLKTTTFGVGELMLDAVNRGVKKIIVGLGGSCTNDLGCGVASACGVKFIDKDGKDFVPTGGSLKDVYDFDISSIDPKLKGVEIQVMCDINNPPYGERGAAKVFAPQKGADPEMVEFLDDGVKHICDLVNDKLGVDLSNLSGGGAAGAMGAGMVAFFGAKLDMGIDIVLNTVSIDKVISDADLIFTGEGKIDSQSLSGKVVIGVARKAKQQGVPVLAVVGGADGELSLAYEQGVSAIFAINKMPQDFSISRNFSKENLTFTMDNILRTLKI